MNLLEQQCIVVFEGDRIEQTNMLSLSKRRIITSTLKFRYRDTRRVKWWLKDENLIPVAQSVVAAIKDITNQTGPSNVEIIKWRKLKIVFRIEDSGDVSKSFIVKAYLLSRFKHRLKYRRRGLNEVANLIRAESRGINTPDVYGYGRINDIFGLVTVSIIIMEDLCGRSAIDELMQTRPQDECSRMLISTVSLFSKLYRGACNLFDMNGGSVMLCEHALDSEAFLVDLERADFYNRPSVEVLMFEAGYFARSCRKWVSTDAIEQWLRELFTAVDINNAAEREKMRERFNYYFGTDLSRKERLRIR